jgi:hypothetical protein
VGPPGKTGLLPQCISLTRGKVWKRKHGWNLTDASFVSTVDFAVPMGGWRVKDLLSTCLRAEDNLEMFGTAQSKAPEVGGGMKAGR